MVLDGRKIADEIIAQLYLQRSSLPADIQLGVLLGAEDPASASFVRIKEQVAKYLHVSLVRELVSEETTTAMAVHAVQWAFRDMAGVIVQLPLPSTLDTDTVLSAIAPQQDVDAVHPHGAHKVRSPVAGALADILVRTGFLVRGQKATVVGAGRLVGQPCAELLREMGAQVSVVTQGQSLEPLKEADIAVLGAGTPGFIKPDMLKPGVFLFDAGTSEQGGKVAGDADPSCAKVAGVFTPVPGGVGPIAVAMIFKNLFTLVQNSHAE